MPYIYSTLANDNTYHLYVKSEHNPKDPQTIVKSILIKGGANIATKQLITPLGVATLVSDEELKILEKDEVFQTHMRNGYIKVDNKKVDVEVVAADMTSRDNSAPVVPEDSNEDDAAKPSTQRTTGKLKNNIR